MNKIKLAVITICVCSVVYSLFLTFSSGSRFKKTLRTVFGLLAVTAVLSVFGKGLDFSDIEDEFKKSFDTQSVGVGARATAEETSRLLSARAEDILQKNGISFQKVDVDMDIGEDGSIIINKAEVYFSGDDRGEAAAKEILRREMQMNFEIKSE